MDFVDVGGAPDFAIRYAAQNGMLLLARRDDAARALLSMTAVMRYPGLAQHLAAEAAIPFLAVPGVALIILAGGQLETVRGGTHADDGSARFDVADDVLQLLVGQVEPAHEDDHQVGCIQGFEAGDVRLVG